MSAFDYLSVLISIILGLGIAQVLSGFGRLLNVRSRVRWYGPRSRCSPGSADAGARSGDAARRGAGA